MPLPIIRDSELTDLSSVGAASGSVQVAPRNSSLMNNNAFFPGDFSSFNQSLNIDQNKMREILLDMNQPVSKQQELAASLNVFLADRMVKDMNDKGFLTDYTRRWVELYNELLTNINRALYGDKSVSLHIHKVSHAHINKLLKQARKERLVQSDSAAEQTAAVEIRSVLEP